MKVAPMALIPGQLILAAAPQAGVVGGPVFGFHLVWFRQYDQNIQPLGALWARNWVYVASKRTGPTGEMVPKVGGDEVPFRTLEVGCQIQEYRRGK
jgi:hypothetical protein